MEKESLVTKLNGESEIQLGKMKLKDEQIVEMQNTAKKAESTLTELTSQLSLQKVSFEAEIKRLNQNSENLTRNVNSLENENLKLSSTK